MLAGLLLLLINFCCPIVALLAQNQQEAVPAASAASGILLAVWSLTGFILIAIYQKLLLERHLQIFVFTIICVISFAACRLSFTDAIRLVPFLVTVGQSLLICSHERARQQERKDRLSRLPQYTSRRSSF